MPFRKGELLYVIEKPEEQWWEALNQEGKTGSIPAPYVTVSGSIALLFSILTIIKPGDPVQSL